MNFLKLFRTHSEYEEEKDRGVELPNVSHCIQEVEVHYEQKTEETRLTLIFNVTNIETQYELFCADATVFPTELEIDGVTIPISDFESTWYDFSTTGQHTVKYKYSDNTVIPSHAFACCSGITKVIIPNCVVSVGVNSDGWVFNGCRNLTDVVFNENTLQNVGGGTFCHCPLNTSVKEKINRLYGQCAVDCD